MDLLSLVFWSGSPPAQSTLPASRPVKSLPQFAPCSGMTLNLPQTTPCQAFLGPQSRSERDLALALRHNVPFLISLCSNYVSSNKLLFKNLIRAGFYFMHWRRSNEKNRGTSALRRLHFSESPPDMESNSKTRTSSACPEASPLTKWSQPFWYCHLESRSIELH